MNDHREPEIDPAIAHLDIPLCDWGPCDRIAVWRIRFHFVNHCEEVCCDRHQARRDEDGNHLIPMCVGHFEQMRQEVSAHVWKLNQRGRATCQSCGAPIACVNDVIRERIKL